MATTKRPTRTINGEEPEPFTEEEWAKIRLAQASFQFFLTYIYPESFGDEKFEDEDGKMVPFRLGRLHYVWASMVEQHSRVCILAPRAHLKSTVLNRGFAFWKLFQARAFCDGVVVSFNDPLAKEHTTKLKEAIDNNPYCRFWKDHSPTAKSVVDYTVGFGDGETWHGKVSPRGIFANMRGLHPKFVICDDILSDFANPLEPTQILRIHNIFSASIQSLPVSTKDNLILIGTPQSYEDTLFKLRKNPEYFWGRFPAEFRDPKTGEQRQQWPEIFGKKHLRRVRRTLQSPAAYQVEYLLVPLMAVDAFLPREVVEDSVDPEMVQWDLDTPFENPDSFQLYGGMDIGKYVHPTHISVLAKLPNGTLVQVYQRFLDGMDYRAQAMLVNKIVAHFKIMRFYYDATRAELDDRIINRRVIGKRFTKRAKGGMAMLLESKFYADEDQDQPGIILLPDERQVNQLVAVNRELESLETADGHGDSFWSNALAIRAAEDGPVITMLGDAQETLGNRKPSNVNPLARGRGLLKNEQ